MNMHKECRWYNLDCAMYVGGVPEAVYGLKAQVIHVGLTATLALYKETE